MIGFFEAYNWYAIARDENLWIKDGGYEALVAWVDYYCVVHPEDQIKFAVVLFIDELRCKKGLPAVGGVHR